MKRIRLLPALALALVCVTRAPAQTDPHLQDRQLPPPESLQAPKALTPEKRGKLQLDFAGTSAFSQRQLREGLARQIQTIENYGLDDANTYDTVFFLESFYRKHGYSQADVTSKVLGPWRLLLTVEEGPLTRVGAITIIGNQAYDTATLTSYLLGPTR